MTASWIFWVKENILWKLTSPAFLNVATRKLKIIYMTRIIFLWTAVLENRPVAPLFERKLPEGRSRVFFALWQVSVINPLEVGECQNLLRRAFPGFTLGLHPTIEGHAWMVLSLRHLCSWRMLHISWPWWPNRQSDERAYSSILHARIPPWK